MHTSMVSSNVCVIDLVMLALFMLACQGREERTQSHPSHICKLQACALQDVTDVRICPRMKLAGTYPPP